MTSIRVLWIRFVSAVGAWRESWFWTRHRALHQRLRLAPPETLDDSLLASFVRWHAHQTEKATKHVSLGPEDPRGLHHSRALQRYLEELERRARSEYAEIVRWATRILEDYGHWSKTPGAIFRSEPPGEPDRANLPTEEEVLGLLQRRTSVRYWRQEEVAPSIVQRLIRAGLESPSSCARMGWHFVAVRQPPLKDPVPAANNKDMLRNAPLIIYLACHNTFYPERFAPALDVGGAAQSILLAAEAHGLRGCPMYQAESFDQGALRRQLGLPRTAYIYLAICLGYPDDAPVKPARPAPEACSTVIDERLHP